MNEITKKFYQDLIIEISREFFIKDYTFTSEYGCYIEPVFNTLRTAPYTIENNILTCKDYPVINIKIEFKDIFSGETYACRGFDIRIEFKTTKYWLHNNNYDYERYKYRGEELIKQIMDLLNLFRNYVVLHDETKKELFEEEFLFHSIDK